MKKENLNHIINLIREQMTTGSTAGAPGFSASADPKGPVAGYDPLMKKKKKYIYMRGVRKNWKSNV